MWRKFYLGIIISSITTGSWGQFKKQFFVEDTKEIKSILVDLSVNSGNCFLRPTKQPGILNVYCNKDSDNFAHSYSKSIEDGVCDINLVLKAKNSESFGQSISSNLFGANFSDDDTLWKIFFSESKPYSVRLNYGVGNADLDLTGLSLSNFNIHSGSADVIVGYKDDEYNKVSMDTFFVKVDMGSVKVKNLNNANSKHILADVGFGNLLLDLSGKPNTSSIIKGNVGAGTLLVILPDKSVPVKVTITDSWLCKVQLPRNFTRIADNTYINESYSEDESGLLEFDMDVSMGNLIFRAE